MSQRTSHYSPYVTMNVITEHALLFQKQFAKKKKKKKKLPWRRQIVFDFSFYYPVRNFILKYEYLSSPIYKSYTWFSVGRWLRFLDVLAYRSSFNRLLCHEIWFWHQITVAHVKKYNSGIICNLNCSCPTTFDVIMGRKESKTVK